MTRCRLGSEGSIALALVMGLGIGPGCDRDSSPAPAAEPAASPAAPAQAEPAETKTAPAPAPDAKVADAAAPDDAAGKAPGGLVASVQQEVDAARAQEALPEAAPPTVGPGDAPLAEVGTVTLPRSTFEAMFALKAKKYADRGRDIPDSARRRYRKSLVERLVHHERLRQRAAELGIEADATALAERVEQQKRGIRDWAKHLERRGETDASLRALYVAELRELAILEARGTLEPSRAEIEADYEKIRGNWSSEKPRVRASHILVRLPEVEGEVAEVDPAVKAKAKAEAQRILALVKAPGADFAELARIHSAGPSATRGGDVGIFTADRMAEPFSKAAFSMKPGEISEVVETKFGFHIIKVIGQWPPGELPIEAIEDQIRERLRQRALHTQRRDLREELTKAYPVVHHELTPEELRDAGSRRSRPPRRTGAHEH